MCDPYTLLNGSAGGGRTWTAYNSTMCSGAGVGSIYDPSKQQCVDKNGNNGSCDVPCMITAAPYHSQRIPKLADWRWTQNATQQCSQKAADPFSVGQQVQQVWATQTCGKPGYHKCIDGQCVLGGGDGDGGCKRK